MIFKTARAKLTAWYLLILMLVSMAFSLVIYKVSLTELERGFRRIQLRMQLEDRAEELGLLPPGFSRQGPDALFEEDLNAARKQIILDLLVLNGVILVFSGTASYFLAGKTLAPIEASLNEQKRFVADASHELRTPLTALKTSIEVALRQKKLSAAEAGAVLKSNLEDIISLEVLSNNLLELSRMQEHGLEMKKTELDKAIKNAYRKIQPAAKKKKIAIKLNLKKVNVWGNQAGLEEMLLIFLDNAVKYSHQGGEITVGMEKGKKETEISVKDNGIGIAKEDLPHIFDRFWRADQARSRAETAGFGLGLALAQKIANLHKGKIKVESRLGKGSNFIIILPLY